MNKNQKILLAVVSLMVICVVISILFATNVIALPSSATPAPSQTAAASTQPLTQTTPAVIPTLAAAVAEKTDVIALPSVETPSTPALTQPTPSAVKEKSDVWSDWALGTCSKQCGGGTLTKTRACLKPADEVSCKGDTTMLENCNPDPCVGWGAWADVGTCSKSCGPGTTTRRRTCMNPALSCEGPNETTGPCNLGPCPIDGVWSEWTGSECSQLCGGGEITQTRTCTAPQYGGKPCDGPATRKIPCNAERCFTKLVINQKTPNIPIDLLELILYDATHKKLTWTGGKIQKSSNYPSGDYPASNLLDENEDTFMHTDSSPSTTQNVRIDFPQSLKIAFIDVVSRTTSLERANNLEIVLYRPNGATETLKLYPGLGWGLAKNRWSFALAPVSTYYWIVIEDMDTGRLGGKQFPATTDVFKVLQECENDSTCSLVTRSSLQNAYIFGNDDASYNSMSARYGSATFIRSDRVDKILNAGELKGCTVPGTFGEACLDVLWKRAGCTTNINPAMNKLNDGKNWSTQQKYWNGRSLYDVSEDMKAWAKGTTPYYTTACRGTPGVQPSPCDGQNSAPISIGCLNDLWKKRGCKTTIPAYYTGKWLTKNKAEVEADMQLYKLDDYNCMTQYVIGSN